MYVRRPCERAVSVILSLFDAPGGVTFSYLEIEKVRKKDKLTAIHTNTMVWRWSVYVRRP